MRYCSTRDSERLNPFSLREAAFLGLAPDGGLFMPERYPQADMDAVDFEARKSFADMALYLSSLPYSALTNDEKFWKGCDTCPHYQELLENNYADCQCTGLLFVP